MFISLDLVPQQRVLATAESSESEHMTSARAGSTGGLLLLSQYRWADRRGAGINKHP